MKPWSVPGGRTAELGTSRIRGVPLVVAAAVVEALRIGFLGERAGEPWVARRLGVVDLVVVVLVVHLNRPSRTSRPVGAAVGLTGLGMAAALGDFLPFPPLMKVLSVGDLLLLLGRWITW